MKRTSNYIPRLTAPSETNEYYLVTRVGGLNECIEIGNGSALPNCVGYAWGRVYEYSGKRPTLSRGNAENWYNYNDGLPRGTEPKIGGVICFRNKNNIRGAGHVAIVEKINSDGTITTSNSSYGGARFETITYAFPYEQGDLVFQGFIYAYDGEPVPPTPIKKKKGFKFYLFDNGR